MRQTVHYMVGEKNAHHGKAIEKGFKARLVNASERKLRRNALHLIGGLQHGSLELMQQVLAAGEPYVFFDRAYFGGGPGSNRLRAVPSAYQKHWLERWPDDRLKALGVEVQPWRNRGRHVLLVPPGDAIENLFGIPGWGRYMEDRLRAAFEGEVIVSRKGLGKPAAEYFQDCWAVVTYTSNVAVEALVAGIPCFVDSKSAAAPMAAALEHLEERIENPPMPDGREGWAASLAYGQFTVDEIASGYAAEIVMPHFRDVAA